MPQAGRDARFPRLEQTNRTAMTGRSALVVDDSKSARFALRRYLEHHRYAVEAAESAEEAMRMLATRKPGVIFLDHVMPGIDGFTALHNLRANPDTARIPVVMCSSNEGPEFNEQARAAGAKCVLQKPPNPEQLQRILEDLERAAALEATPAASPPAVSAVVADAEPPAVAAPASPDPGPQAPAMPAVAAAPVAAPVPADPAPAEHLMPEPLEARLKALSQGLFEQFAEVRVTVAHLARQQDQLAGLPTEPHAELRSGLEEAQQALRGVSARIEAVERQMLAQLTAMRTQLDALLETQAQRIAEVTQAARQAAMEEAQIVAERTVMAAAMRISDQIASAVLGAAQRR
jgi:CheY-like chemotaxis protein